MPNSKLEISRGDILASKYEVLDLLDESPLGLTYRVKHLKSGKFVRLTMLRSKIIGRDQKELLKDAFKEAKALQHPNHMTGGELGEHDGVAYYTMEDFDGTPLREILQEYKIEGKQFSLKDAAQVVIQVLEALAVVHDTGRVMRALRPEHILVNVRYTGPRRQNFVAQVKLVGAIFWNLVPAGVLAEDEFSRGEAQYIAPELKSFEPVPTSRSDIYSAGVTFYEMLTGTAPIGTFQLPTTLRPDLPKHVNNIIELALANAPEDRYRTAKDLIQDIQRTFDETVEDDTPVKPVIGLLAIGVGVGLVVGITLLVYTLVPNADSLQHNAQVADQKIRSAVKQYYTENAMTEAEVAQVMANHPKGMILIPKGPYIAGRLQYDPNAMTKEPLSVKRELDGYLIDIFEYPNQLKSKPINGVTGIKAAELCEAAGKRLCTVEEWEKACKGPSSLIYSYGDDYDLPDPDDPSAKTRCGGGFQTLSTWTSGAHVDCRSQWGVFDQSGGFAEWTSSAPANDANRRFIKGGNTNGEKGTRCGYYTDESVGYGGATMSFRCCRSIDAVPLETEPVQEE